MITVLKKNFTSPTWTGVLAEAYTCHVQGEASQVCCSTQSHHIFHLKSTLCLNVPSTFENNLFLLLIYKEKPAAFA